MILKNIKVYHLFWIIASIILIIGLSNHNDTLDINVHDTYFVVAYLHVTIALFLFYFLNGLGYWLIQKQLKKKLLKPLTIIHSTILIGSFIIYWLIIFLDDKLFVIDPNFPLLNYKNEIINMTLVSEFLLIVFLAFPIFIINLFVSLLRRTNNIKT